MGIAAAAVLLVWQVHASLLGGLDTAVSQRAQAVADQAKGGPLPRRLTETSLSAPAVQVVDSRGAVISHSRGADDEHRMFSAQASSGRSSPLITTLPEESEDDDDGKTYRVALVAVASKTQGRLTIYAALPTKSVMESTTELTAALAVGGPVLIGLLAVLSWLLVGGALRPVERLRAQAAAISGTDLEQRLAAPAARDELSRLAMTLNALLGRIQASSDRQRQFIADAAHELRSPIASMAAQLEVALLHPEQVVSGSWVEGLLADTRRLGHLAEDLLALARLDANPEPRRQIVDLDDLLLDEVRRSRTRGRRIDATAVSAGRVKGDPVGLTRVVRNLIDNAIRYAASTVTVTLRSAGGRVTLIVADDGPGIPAADRQRVFERFIRLDSARSRDAGGSGLGLAIVAEVVRGHGGSVAVGDNGPGARVTVTLPAAE